MFFTFSTIYRVQFLAHLVKGILNLTVLFKSIVHALFIVCTYIFLCRI